MNVVRVAEALRQALSLKNAVTAGGYGYVLSDDRRSLYEALEAVMEADDEVYAEAAQLPWVRAELAIESADIPHGAEIPAHFGPLLGVFIKRTAGDSDYKRARGRRAATEIERLRANAGSIYGALAHTDAGSPLSGFFDLTEEDLLHFTGAAARVRYVPAYARLQRTVHDAGVDTSVNPRHVNSASAAFVADDVGSVLILAGAGASGVPLGAEVRTRNSASQALTVEPASTTVTNQQLVLARCQSPAVFQGLVVSLAQMKLTKEGDSESRAEFVRRSVRALRTEVAA